MNQPGGSGRESGGHERRRRRRRSSRHGERASTGTSGQRRPGSFERAIRHTEPPRAATDKNHIAWLWVLGLLVAGTVAFAYFLHERRSAPHQLAGEAPSTLLFPSIDPILAPLETGTTGYSLENLAELQSVFRAESEKANIDDRDIFITAASIAQILQEAAEDRVRHLERLQKLGTNIEGMSPDPPARTDIDENERKHLQLAVAISWQRNSVTYRNRVEELWYRLLRLEQGRFREGSAPHSMLPALPTPLGDGVSAPSSVEPQKP